eukprot:gene13367-11755_t
MLDNQAGTAMPAREPLGKELPSRKEMLRKWSMEGLRELAEERGVFQGFDLELLSKSELAD